MSANIDLYVDSGGSGLISGGSAPGGNLPTLTRNDVYTFRLRVQEAPAGVTPYDIDLTGAILRVGIGNIDDEPTDGEFNLTRPGPVTSSAISYNATTTQVYNAISGIAGTGVLVTTYGTQPNAWLITAQTANTSLSFGGVTGSLFPTSSVIINTRRLKAANVKEQQSIQLKRNPAVFANNFVTASTANVVSLSKIQDGSSSANETYRLSIGADAIGGTYTLAYGSNVTTAIPLGTTAVSVQTILSAVSGIGAGNITVSDLAGSSGFAIAFAGSLGSINITTALSLNATGINFAPWKTATVTMATAELDELFLEAGTDTISPTLEIELSQNGNPKTLSQSSVTIRKDLITTGASVPASSESYYTKAESDTRFVLDDYDNVSSTDRTLSDSSAVYSLDWGDRNLFSADGNQSISYESREAFDGVGQQSIDWENRVLKSAGGSSMVHWQSGSLYDEANQCFALFWNDEHALLDNSGIRSCDWSARILLNDGEQSVLNWNSRHLYGSDGTVCLDWSLGRTASSVITFGSIPANGSTVVTRTVTGATTNSLVLLGLPTATSSGVFFQGAVSGANVVKLTAFNVTTSAITQSGQTFRITTFGY